MNYSVVIKLPQYFRNLQRVSEITAVLIKHGFGDIVQRLRISEYLHANLRFDLLFERRPKLDFGTRLRLACEELGPTFIKFAQLISTRPDIFPLGVIQELRLLQDKVPPFSSTVAKEMVAKELGAPILEVFSFFDDVPLAAASMAQVHAATLKSGEDVVVKIQRPHLDRIVATDLDILRGLAALVEEHISESRPFSPVDLVEEFARSLKRECDFRREAQNITAFAKNFSDQQTLVVPKVYQQYCGRKVLVEERIHGVRIDDLEAIKAQGIAADAILDNLTGVVLRSIFEFRFFHADPHPGNIFLTHDGKVALIDFGAMGRLEHSRLMDVLELLLAVLTEDLEKIIRALHESDMAPALLNERALKLELEELLSVYLGERLGDLDLSKLLSDLFEIVMRYGIRPPADILTIGKSLTILEALAAKLDPNFRPLERLLPYLQRRYLTLLTDPGRYARQILAVSEAYRRLIVSIPNLGKEILQQLPRGLLTVQTSKADGELERIATNRLVNRTLFSVLGLVFFSLGVSLISHGNEMSLGYVLVIIGIFSIVRVVIAIERSGGV